MRFLRAIGYGFARAFMGAKLRPMTTLLAIGAIGVAFLLIGMVYLAATNVARLTSSWGRGVQMVVYLDDEVPAERARTIAQILSGASGVAHVDYIPKEVALERLRQSLGSRKDLLSGAELGYLPASLEVMFTEGIRDIATVSPLVEKLRSAKGVEEVEFLGDWVEKIAALSAALRMAALVLAILVAAASLYIVTSTIKLGAHIRKDEIEILKLVGATDGFVKAPMVIEGALQGTVGALGAVGLLYALFRLGGPAIETLLGTTFGDLHLTFLPASALAVIVFGGTVIGVTGSFLAIGRYAEV